MIAVTGATGHLGTWVVARLTDLGHEVVCVSRRPSPSSSIEGARWSRAVRTLACDLARPDAPAILRGGLAGVRAVVHLAAFVPGDTGAMAPADAQGSLATNVAGTARLLEGLASIESLRGLVHASTFEVYGSAPAGPIAEEHRTEPLTFHGAGKLAAEKYVALFGADRGVACCSLRLSALYGPGARRRHAVNDLLRAAAAGDPLAVAGDGTRRCDAITAADAAEAIRLALEGSARGILNVGSGGGHSLLDVARTLARVSGGALPIGRCEPDTTATGAVLATDRIRGRLGWAPSCCLEDGLRAQLDWIRREG